MSLMKWNRPIESMPVFSDMFNSLFGRDISDFIGESKGTVPTVNIAESENDYKVEVAAPGMTKEDFDINLDNGVLTISGKKEDSKEQKEENYLRKEHSYTSFQRSFHVADLVETEKIEANYKDGILLVTLPKKEEVPVVICLS